MDIQQALTEAVEAALPAPTPTPAPETEPQEAAETQDAVSQDTPEVAPEDAPEESTEDTAESSEESSALPDGYVAVPVVEDALATEFTLKDADGEVEVPALIVEYKANGKVRQDRLDQVVKLAQFGVYNEEREQRVKEIDQLAGQLVGERDELFQRLQTIEQQFERALQDENFFYLVKEAYESESSPERRAQRAENEVQRVRMEAQLAPITQQGEAFYTREITPAIELITNALPSVTSEELATRMAYAMQLHVETAPNGAQYVPPSQYDAVRSYIVNDLAHWAQMQHARRTQATPSTAQEEALSAELAKAQVSAQKAKRAVGQATRPVGRAGSTPAKPKVAKAATVDDAVNSAMSEILSSFR